MEMGGIEAGNKPKSYSLNMFKDFVPMCVFSETNQGKDQKTGLWVYLCSSVFRFMNA